MAEVLLITALVLALFFIFFVRPARAAQGRRRKDLNDLRIGDEVLTTGGIIATVIAVETPPHGPMILQLEIDEDVVVRARTVAIEELLRTADEVQQARDADSRDAESEATAASTAAVAPPTEGAGGAADSSSDDRGGAAALSTSGHGDAQPRQVTGG
jgi:preprotein translocase YajC subunit